MVNNPTSYTLPDYLEILQSLGIKHRFLKGAKFSAVFVYRNGVRKLDLLFNITDQKLIGVSACPFKVDIFDVL